MDTDDMSASDARPCEIETALIENQNHVYEIFRYEAARDEIGCRARRLDDYLGIQLSREMPVRRANRLAGDCAL